MRAGEPSLTARGVALARSLLTRSATETGDPAGDAALAATLTAGMTEADRQRFDRAGGDGVGDFLGMVRVRTDFFDQAVLRAEESGIEQVVILGAGYDGRALRFRAPGVRFFEVDHPATQADKRARLEQAGVDAADIIFVAADFTEPGLAAALAGAGHRAGDRSLFLCEGVLRYLPERWFRELLAVTAQVAAPGSELAVSISTARHSETTEAARRRQAHEAQLAESGEAVLTVPERSVALAWLAASGWTADAVVDMADLAPGTHPGRLLVTAGVRP